MDINICKAQLSDIDELEMLYDDICDFLATKEYNPGWRKGYFPTRQEALYFLESDTLYTVKIGGKIVGSVALTHSPNAETDKNCRISELEYDDILFIHILVVHPDYLHKGIGTSILEFAKRCAKQENIKAIRLYVYENNSVAIKAYEKNGYVCIGKADIGLREYGLEWFFLYEKVIV